MLSYDQAAAKKQWREAVRAARLDAVEEWIGESRQWLLAGLRQGRIDSRLPSSRRGFLDSNIAFAMIRPPRN
jgi:hypothetical protein